MDIALIVGVILGLAAMIGSIAYALFVEGSAGGFGNFLSAPSFGIVFGGMIASIFVAFPMPHVVALGKAIGAVLKPADDKMGPLVDEAVEVHLAYFEEVLQNDFPNGKKLGFISQEMGREINTIGSKANHAALQKVVVQMKDELEKIKEQLLNVL